VNKAFTPRVVEEMRPRITQLVGELLDAVEARGSCELIEDLAYPLPVTVISDMLGVPREDAETFKAWSRELARSSTRDQRAPEVIEKRNQAALASSNTSPPDRGAAQVAARDLLSALIAAEEAGDRLNQQELLATCILLLVAGHETTVNLVGNGALALLRHPDQLDMLRADPALIRTAIEEALRFDPPVQLTARTALQDIELASGRYARASSRAAHRRSEPRPAPVRRFRALRHYARRTTVISPSAWASISVSARRSRASKARSPSPNWRALPRHSARDR